MSAFQGDLCAFLSAVPVVSAKAVCGVWWLQAPDNSRDYIVIRQVSGVREGDHGGDDGCARARVQCDCVATSWADAVALRNAVTGALSGYRGVIGTTSFDAVFHVSDMDFREPEISAFRALADFELHYRLTT